MCSKKSYGHQQLRYIHKEIRGITSGGKFKEVQRGALNVAKEGPNGEDKGMEQLLELYALVAGGARQREMLTLSLTLQGSLQRGIEVRERHL